MRLIDADTLMDDIDHTVRFSCRDGVPSAEMRGANKVIDRINAAPTLSPDEVRGVGKWIEKEVYNLEYTTIEQMQSASCSVCGKIHTTPFSYYFSKYNYCPNCGAKMEVSEDA